MFEMVEVDGPEGELADFDLDSWLADSALDIYYRGEAAGEHVITPTPILYDVNEQLPSSAKRDLEISLIPAIRKSGNPQSIFKGIWGQKKTLSHLTHLILFALEAKLPNDNLGVQPC